MKFACLAAILLAPLAIAFSQDSTKWDWKPTQSETFALKAGQEQLFSIPPFAKVRFNVRSSRPVNINFSKSGTDCVRHHTLATEVTCKAGSTGDVVTITDDRNPETLIRFFNNVKVTVFSWSCVEGDCPQPTASF